MNNSVVFFYANSIRWSFGFENPNKAAVIFACLLPLLFLVWTSAWSLKRSWWLKGSVLIFAGALILADASCLFKTYSRGGVVAAALGVLYFIIRTGWHRRTSSWTLLFRSARFNLTLILLGFLMVIFVWVGLGERSFKPAMASDTSAGHRLILWRSSLQMATENPYGFGTGRSGEAYMQWYQAIDATSEYRTMVNSYLTLLVEQGWLKFTLVLLVASLFWAWAQAGARSTRFDIATGLRASILAFLISGIFSTVMEEPLLWIIPACCILILAAWAVVTRISFSWSKAAFATAPLLVVLIALYVGGLIESRTDPLARKFAQGPDGRTASELALKKNISGQKTWFVVPDATVLGPYYGKLLRQMVAETGVTLKLKNSTELQGPVDRLLLIGNAAKAAPVTSTSITVLLTPAVTSDANAQAWSSSSPHLILLIPSIDEDRRSHFWQNSTADSKLPNVTITKLNGVGLRVDWDWEDVISLIKNS